MHSTIELTCALANIFDQKKIDQVDPVLMKIGVFHQVQVYKFNSHFLPKLTLSVTRTTLKTSSATKVTF